MELFVKIVDGFASVAIFTKAPSQMFDWVLDAPLCSKHINKYFHQIYLLDKSDTENESLIVSD